MNISSFLSAISSYLILFPSAFLCFVPVRKHLKYSRKKIFLLFAGAMLMVLPLSGFLELVLDPQRNTIFVPLIILLYFAYQSCLNLHPSKSLSVFFFTAAFLSFITNFSFGLDAWINYPVQRLPLNDIQIQFIMVLMTAAALYYPLSRFGEELIDTFHAPNVWYMSAVVSFMFLVLNLTLVPEEYKTFYSNNVFQIFWVLCTLLFSLFLLLTASYYYIVHILTKMAETAEKNRILEMQEAQYHSQQSYIERTARVRHDFKQTLRTLKTLSQKKDYEALDNYLTQYNESMLENEYTTWVKSRPVNAILNYYMQSAKEKQIRTDWHILLPDQLPVNDIDLCSILGNILENAIIACEAIPAEERHIDLSMTVESQSSLFIVVTNSFSGKVRKRDGVYYSTHHRGQGLGLPSVASTIQRYGGIVRFSHSGKEFDTDIMIPLSIDTETQNTE